MGFLDASIVDAKTISRGGTYAAVAQRAIPTYVSTASKSVLGSVGGVTSKASQVQTTVAQTLATANTASRFIQDALKSVNDTFGSSATGLANGISGRLSSIFKDTNIKPASVVSSKISDPVYTNLLSQKTPTSSAFKIDGLQTGSQIVTMAGASAKFGSGAELMTGTQQSTVLDRFNLDSITNLGTTLNSSMASSKVNGLFSFATKAASTARTVSLNVRNVTSQVSRAVNAVNREVNAVARVINAAERTVDSLSNISSLNDFSYFMGNVSGLSSSLNNFDLSTYYLVNTAESLLDENGIAVGTNRSGVDSTTANGVLDAMRRAGCSSSVGHYDSANNRASLFNLSLDLAARNGMMREVTSLLGCSQAGTVTGQQALNRAFTSASGSQVAASDLIMRSITNSAALKTNNVYKNILTNPNLTFSDVGVVDNIFAMMGTTATAAYTVPSASSDRYPVFDASLFSASQPAFLNGLFKDNTISDYLNAQELNVKPNGTFTYG